MSDRPSRASWTALALLAVVAAAAVIALAALATGAGAVSTPWPRYTPPASPPPDDDIRMTPPYSEVHGGFTVPNLQVFDRYVFCTAAMLDEDRQHDYPHVWRSADGGHTFAHQRVADIPMGGKIPLVRPDGADEDDPHLYLAFGSEHAVHLGHSTDYGDTWHTRPITSSEESWRIVHPMIAADHNQVIYALVLRRCSPQGTEMCYYVASSGDDGATWSSWTHLFAGSHNGGYEDQRILARDGAVYVMATPPEGLHGLRFTRSTDRGKTWSPVVQINDYWDSAFDFDVDAAGTLQATFTYDYAAEPNEGDGGAAVPRDTVFATHSTDGGLTWSPEVMVSDTPPCPEDPALVSISSALEIDEATGAVFVAMDDQRNHCGEVSFMSDVFLSYSTDGGHTWSPNEQISNARPDALIAMYQDMVIDDGGVYTAWYEFSGGEYGGYWLDRHAVPALPPTPTPTATATSTPTPSATPSPSPPATATATATATPSPSPTATATPTAAPPAWRVFLPGVGKSQ